MNTLTSAENSSEEDGVLVFTKRLLAHLAVDNTTIKTALIALQKDPIIEQLIPTIHKSLTEYVDSVPMVPIGEYINELFELPIFSVFYRQIALSSIKSGQPIEICFRQLLSVAAFEKNI